jgi:VWFA-related protein
LKRLLLGFIVVGAVVALYPQQLSHVVGVLNVEVPVRVFDGDKFVDGLGIEDFEVFEDGQPQEVKALYLVRKSDIQREQKMSPAASVTAPKTSRNIVLLFEIIDVVPRLNEAVDYLFDQVVRPDDILTVVTPRTTYTLKPGAVNRQPRKELAGQLLARLRKDVLQGASEYRSLVRDIIDCYRSDVERDLKEFMLLDFARQLRDRISIDEKRLREFAQALKAKEGQKCVFLFYQKELIYVPGLGDFSKFELLRNLNFSPKDINRHFADASITVHFLFLNQRPTAGLDDLDTTRMPSFSDDSHDLSSSLYSAFRDIAVSTGGITETSVNPAAAFRKAVTASENYYLLYYAPRDYKADGKFKEIKVRVKGKNYRVTHRAGYFAD